MTPTPSHRAAALAAALALGIGGSLSLVLATPAGAATAPVQLGTADAFAVLGGSTVTNVGSSVLTGDLGLSPGTAVTGFPPGIVNGSLHVADAVALQAQVDTTTAYNSVAGRALDQTVTADLGGQTLAPGVYDSATSLSLTGPLMLDAGGDPSAVFILRAGSTLTTASNSSVVLLNGASACNVFWEVGSSATLGTGTAFQGTILALTSITADTGSTVTGRLLARNGAVTLDTDTVTRPTCLAVGSGTPSVTPTATSGTSPVTSAPTTAPPVTPTTAAPSVTSAPSASASASASPVASPSGSASVAPGAGAPARPASPAASVTAAPGAPSVPVAPPAPGVVTGNGTTGVTSVPGVPENGLTGGSLGSPPGTGTPTLPRTGADIGTAAPLGVAAIVAGFLLVLASRDPAARRQARHRG